MKIMKSIKKDKNKEENFEQWKERTERIMDDTRMATDPVMRAELIALQALIESGKNTQQFAKESYEKQREEMFHFYIFIIVAIPLIVIMWNLHPVLGILGIIGYIWLIRNKLQTGYYLG